VTEEESVEEKAKTHKKAGKGSSVGKLVLIIVLTLVSSAGGVLSGFLIVRMVHVDIKVQREQAGEQIFEEQNLAEILEASATISRDVTFADSAIQS
jgi:flagellar basal body-associated protein FliL